MTELASYAIDGIDVALGASASAAFTIACRMMHGIDSPLPPLDVIIKHLRLEFQDQRLWWCTALRLHIFTYAYIRSTFWSQKIEIEIETLIFFRQNQLKLIIHLIVQIAPTLHCSTGSEFQLLTSCCVIHRDILIIRKYTWPQRGWQWIVAYRLQGEGLVWLIGVVVYLSCCTAGLVVCYYGQWMAA